MQGGKKSVVSALHRLAVACLQEEATLALDGAALGGERGERLREQAGRRRVFRQDLAVGISVLGGTPIQRLSLLSRLGALLRHLPTLWFGPRRGAAYARSALAVERTARAYERVLASDLPAAARFGLERQQEEIDYDRKELRWLRYGGSLGPLPGPRIRRSPGGPSDPSAGNDLSLQVWRDDGGREGPRSASG
jgi:hypothetical protein